jgi:hypothetical protein
MVTIPGFMCRIQGRPWKLSVKIIGNQAKIETNIFQIKIYSFTSMFGMKEPRLTHTLLFLLSVWQRAVSDVPNSVQLPYYVNTSHVSHKAAGELINITCLFFFFNQLICAFID